MKKNIKSYLMLAFGLDTPHPMTEDGPFPIHEISLGERARA